MPSGVLNKPDWVWKCNFLGFPFLLKIPSFTKSLKLGYTDKNVSYQYETNLLKGFLTNVNLK